MNRAGRARRKFFLQGGMLPLALCAAASCGHLSGPRMLLAEHPLVGRIWHAGGGRFVDRAQLVAHLARADAVLLGESHDNPDHHRIQLRLIEDLRATGVQRALVMEQFDLEHQAAIEAASREPGATADDVATAGRLDRDGWDWPLYRPLVARALAQGMPVVAANLSRARARQIVSSGLDALGAAGRRLPLDTTWSAERDRKMAQLIHDGHCGQAPESVVQGIVLAQRARDATMAEAMQPHLPRGVVAILGRGHARRDLGVPLYLAALSPAGSVSVVGLVEVEHGSVDPAAYASEEGDGAYDYVWFTARAERRDPCSGMQAGRLPVSAAR